MIFQSERQPGIASHVPAFGTTGRHAAGRGVMRFGRRGSTWGVFGAILVCGVLLNGCFVGHKEIVVGPDIPAEVVGQISIGKTTRSDLFRMLGPPFSIFQGPTMLTEVHTLGFYSYQAGRSLQSLGDRQYGLLYRFSKVTGRSVFILVTGDVKVSIKANELLLLLDESTHVLEDFAYRRDI